MRTNSARWCLTTIEPCVQARRTAYARVGAVDSTLLDLTEWCCRRWQLLTGRTNVWLAVQLTNVSVIVYFVWAGVYFWGSTPLARGVIAVFCTGLLYLLTQTIFKVPIETSEANAYRRVAKGLRNPRRLRDALLRTLFLTLSLVLLYPVTVVYTYLDLGVARTQLFAHRAHHGAVVRARLRSTAAVRRETRGLARFARRPLAGGTKNEELKAKNETKNEERRTRNEERRTCGYPGRAHMRC